MLAVKDPDVDPDPAFQVNPDQVSDPVDDQKNTGICSNKKHYAKWG
jgi:hypothetical protein